MTSPGIVPIYRGLTIVGTVLTCDEQGEAILRLVTTTTIPGFDEVAYELLPSRSKEQR